MDRIGFMVFPLLLVRAFGTHRLNRSHPWHVFFVHLTFELGHTARNQAVQCINFLCQLIAELVHLLCLSWRWGEGRAVDLAIEAIDSCTDAPNTRPEFVRVLRDLVGIAFE